MINTSERGSIVLYALLSLAVMLAIGLSLNALFISEFKAATQARNTVDALYAADSAAEKCLYEAHLGANEPPLVFSSGATYDVASPSTPSIDMTDQCASLGKKSFRFRATGTYRGSRRTLEISQ